MMGIMCVDKIWWFPIDSEQQEIYHAARTIQHAFRKRKIQVCTKN